MAKGQNLPRHEPDRYLKYLTENDKDKIALEHGNKDKQINLLEEGFSNAGMNFVVSENTSFNDNDWNMLINGIEEERADLVGDIIKKRDLGIKPRKIPKVRKPSIRLKPPKKNIQVTSYRETKSYSRSFRKWSVAEERFIEERRWYVDNKLLLKEYEEAFGETRSLSSISTKKVRLRKKANKNGKRIIK